MEAAARAALNAAATGVPLDQFHVRGGLTFAGVNGQPDGAVRRRRRTTGCRASGATYKLDDKTVLRGGYGMFYGFLGQRRGDVITSGFSSNTPMTVSLDNGLTFIETLSNPFRGGIIEPVGAAAGIETFLGQSDHVLRSEPEVAAQCSAGRSASSASCPAAGSRTSPTSATTAPICRPGATSTRRRTST